MVDHFIASVHAVAETGEVVIVSRTGSQLAGYVYSARNVVWIIGAQKITPNLETAIRRVREHTLPLKPARIRQAGSTDDSMIGKILIVENERQEGRVSAVIVRSPSASEQRLAPLSRAAPVPRYALAVGPPARTWAQAQSLAKFSRKELHGPHSFCPHNYVGTLAPQARRSICHRGHDCPLHRSFAIPLSPPYTHAPW